MPVRHTMDLPENLLALVPNFEIDRTAMDEGRLFSYELFWRDNYHWLKGKGYLLRPRYHPDWVASWKGTEKKGQQCEDGQRLRVSQCVHLNCKDYMTEIMSHRTRA